MVPAIRRFELAVSEPFHVATGDDQPPEPEEQVIENPRRVARKVGRGGRISLATFNFS
jgi:hypothetical protein